MEEDKTELVVGVGRLDQVAPRLSKQGIVADPETGQGCVRGPDSHIPILMDEQIIEALRKEGIGDGADGGGQRLNAGKNKMELTPSEWEWALADVTTQGSKKYAERNWELGMKWSTMIGCMKRHIAKFQAGERYDGPEFSIENGTTGCHHLAMVAWNALALMTYDLREIGDNDLAEGEQLDLFDRVNASTSDLPLEFHQETK